MKLMVKGVALVPVGDAEIGGIEGALVFVVAGSSESLLLIMIRLTRSRLSSGCLVFT